MYRGVLAISSRSCPILFLSPLSDAGLSESRPSHSMAISSRSSSWVLSFPLVLPESVLLAPEHAEPHHQFHPDSSHHAATRHFPWFVGPRAPGRSCGFALDLISPHLASVRCATRLFVLWLSQVSSNCSFILLSFSDIGLPNQWSRAFHVLSANRHSLSTFLSSVLYPLISFVPLRPNFFVVLYLDSTALNGHSYYWSLLYGVIPHI